MFIEFILKEQRAEFKISCQVEPIPILFKLTELQQQAWLVHSCLLFAYSWNICPTWWCELSQYVHLLSIHILFPVVEMALWKEAYLLAGILGLILQLH